MDEAGAMALAYVASWSAVRKPEVTGVEKINIWKRIPDDAVDIDRSHVVAYKVSGRFEWGEEDEGYNRFMFLVEPVSRRVRGFMVLGGFMPLIDDFRRPFTDGPGATS